MPRTSRYLSYIQSLDPEHDHQKIMRILTCYEFPWDMARSLEFALYRTYAVTSISTVLANTGEFFRRPQKRYDDTDLILSEIMEHGYDSERGKAALRQMNRMHKRFQIENDNFVYVLSTFIYDPIHWIDSYGYRPLIEKEKLAMFYFWREVGHHMNVTSIPTDFLEYERFKEDYEHTHYHHTESSHRLAVKTRDLFLGWYLPSPIRPLGAPIIHAFLDDNLLNAFGFRKPPAFLLHLLQGVLRLRGQIVARLPERRKPHKRTRMRRRSYPEGYDIAELGTHQQTPNI